MFQFIQRFKLSHLQWVEWWFIHERIFIDSYQILCSRSIKKCIRKTIEFVDQNIKNVEYEYKHLMQNAMNVDNLQIVNWDNRFLYWYEECFFIFQIINNRSSYWYEDCSFTFQFTDNRVSYWYEDCSFTFQFTNKRCTFHINDHVKLIFKKIVQIFHIYFHSFNQHALRRVYV
jgi:hypothetical protein